MQIKTASVLVDDQDKALKFYTEKLGFVKKVDTPDGDSPWRMLTVAPKGDTTGIDLELEHAYFPSAKTLQKEQFEAEYAAVGFQTNDVQADYTRLKKAGVVFHGEPQDGGPVIYVKFEDTCGNLINLIQPKG